MHLLWEIQAIILLGFHYFFYPFTHSNWELLLYLLFVQLLLHLVLRRNSQFFFLFLFVLRRLLSAILVLLLWSQVLQVVLPFHAILNTIFIKVGSVEVLLWDLVRLETHFSERVWVLKLNILVYYWFYLPVGFVLPEVVRSFWFDGILRLELLIKRKIFVWKVLR